MLAAALSRNAGDAGRSGAPGRAHRTSTNGRAAGSGTHDRHLCAGLARGGTETR